MTENQTPDPLDWTPNNLHRPAEYPLSAASGVLAEPFAARRPDHRSRWQLAVGLTAGALLAGTVGGLASANLSSATSHPAADPPLRNSSSTYNVGGTGTHLLPTADDNGEDSGLAND